MRFGGMGETGRVGVQSCEIVEHSSKVDILLLLRQGMNCFNRGRTKVPAAAPSTVSVSWRVVFVVIGIRGGVAPTERLAKSVWVGVRLGSVS